MVKIGNIVTFNKSKINLEQFHILSDISEVTNNLPTLFVGYTDTKDIFKDLNFIDRKLGVNIFWTTTRIEDRDIFSKDLEKFMDFCELKLLQDFSYFFYNPFELNKTRTKRLIKKLKSTKGSVYIHRHMIYLYIDGVTYGFHDEIGEVFGISRERIFKFLHSNGHTLISEEETDSLQKSFECITYDQSQLLYLKENFT